MKKIYKLYLKLQKKYKKPSSFWQKWCKQVKSKKDKEEIVLGAILTQRTNWKNVELALENLRKEKFLSIEKIYKLGKEKKELLENLIKPSGFYKQKARRIFLFCEFIVKKYRTLKNFFKHDLKICREQLLGLNGIGPETADSILLYAGHKPVFVIDEYTKRFVRKHKLSDNISYNYLQKIFEQNLPKDIKVYQEFHAMIVFEGKRVGSTHFLDRLYFRNLR